MLFKLKLKIFFILISSFLIYFLPNALLYVKWTRFAAPIFPLFTIFAGYFLSKLRLNWKLDYWIIGLLVFISVLPGIAFFSIYLKPDVRIIASDWIYNSISANSYILSETANVVDIPIHLPSLRPTTYNLQLISFNFYDLDENSFRFEELLNHLTKADYIFVPSRRVFANHTRLPNKYPLSTKYYQLLFSGKLGFEKAAEFRSLEGLPQGLLLGDLFDDELAEETFTVFDHPVIRIYKKNIEYQKKDYRRLFNE